jgi:hypothetical protein
MTFLQQQMLVPTKHVEEIALLNSVLRYLQEGDTLSAKMVCMSRLVSLEKVAAPKLVEFRQEAA